MGALTLIENAYDSTVSSVFGAASNSYQSYKINRERKQYLKVIRNRIPSAHNMLSNGGNFLDASNFIYSGEKFAGGWGFNKNYEVVNLPEVRAHSLELYRSNPVAVSIFGRLETKVINDGLRVEALPESRFLGFSDEDAFIQNWTDTSEAYMHLYACDKLLVDYRKRFNLYQLQRQAYSTAKLSGDCLVIRRIDPVTQLPNIQLVDGMHIHTPFEFSIGINPKTGNNVVSGVEIDDKGREVGYWVRTRAFNPNTNNLVNFGMLFVPAFGDNSGRRVANLIYGSRLRVDEYRGMPLLGHTMQLLKHIDTALDTANLSMILDAQLVMSVVTDKDAPDSAQSAMGGGIFRQGAVNTKTVNAPQSNGGTKALQISQFGPGMLIENLARGKKIESHNTRHPNPDLSKSVLFGLNLASASCEVPPEIALLMFNNNFSASRQAVNEFDAVRRKEHSQFNPQMNDPIYQDVIVGLDITGKLITPGLMEAILNNKRLTFNAWMQASWASTAELSVDMLKHINMFEKAHKNGYVTRDAVSLKYFGTRHKKVVGRLTIENEALAKANKPLVELEKTDGG